MRVRNNEQDAKQKTTRANGLKAIEVPTACVSGPGYGTLWKGFRGPRGALRSPWARFWEVLERFRGSPGLLAGPQGNPRASWEPWKGPTGVLGDYEVVLGTSCRLLKELLKVLWGSLGAIGRALGRSSGGPWWSLGFSGPLQGQFQNG